MEHETRAGQQAEEAGYQQTKAIITALDRGMSLEQVEAAVEGHPWGDGLKRCEMCGQPTRERMTSARGSVCPDCYDRANG